jgi:hypothetical protein
MDVNLTGSCVRKFLSQEDIGGRKTVQIYGKLTEISKYIGWYQFRKSKWKSLQHEEKT